MDAVPYLAFLSALAALGLAAFFYLDVKKASPGSDRMIFLMTEIQNGAKAFLKAEYTWVAGFATLMALLVAVVIAPPSICSGAA